MSFAKIIFQKDIYSIQLSDVEDFFSTEQEETAILEFKSGKVELEDVYREACAFMNSEGGLLIVGSPIEVKNKAKTKKVCTGSLVPSPISDKNTIVRGIASNISPSPHGIRVHEIDCREGKIFIVDIPKSMSPPHQVNKEGKYYLRLETEARPAPHGFVEALFFRRQKPDLRLYVSIDHSESPNTLTVTFSLVNESPYTAEQVGYIVEIKGLYQFAEMENVVTNYQFKNGTLSFQESPMPSIIVKGISCNFSLKIMPQIDIFLISCFYWCKDTQAETKVGIYNAKEKKFTNSFSSIRNDNLHTREDLLEAFDELVKGFEGFHSGFGNSQF